MNMKKVIRSVSLTDAASKLADKVRGQVPFSAYIENLILAQDAPTVARNIKSKQDGKKAKA